MRYSPSFTENVCTFSELATFFVLFFNPEWQTFISPAEVSWVQRYKFVLLSFSKVWNKQLTVLTNVAGHDIITSQRFQICLFSSQTQACDLLSISINILCKLQTLPLVRGTMTHVGTTDENSLCTIQVCRTVKAPRITNKSDTTTSERSGEHSSRKHLSIWLVLTTFRT